LKPLLAAVIFQRQAFEQSVLFFRNAVRSGPNSNVANHAQNIAAKRGATI